MKIIHCSDIHLDSKMEGSDTISRKNEILNTFAKMIKYANEFEVRAIIIAGDLFDTEKVSPKTKDYVLDIIKNNPNIDFLYLKGNHDLAFNMFSSNGLPQNFKPFYNEWTQYEYGNIKILGVELDSSNYSSIYSSLKLDENNINIVVMHGQESVVSKIDTININELKNKNINYLALGHYHSYNITHLDKRGVYCYSGCLEGRGYDEVGEKGFVLLEINDSIETKFIKGQAYRTVYEVNVDITGLITYMQILDAIKVATSHIDKKHYVKIVLKGNYLLSTQKDINHLTLDLKELFYSIKIYDETTLTIDPKEFEYDISLKGEFIRSVYQSDFTDKEKADIIMCGILSLRGEEFVL